MDNLQKNGQTLLEAMETAGASPSFHCRDGFCGMCKTKINPEDIENIQAVGDALGLHDRETEILPCVSTLREGKADLIMSGTGAAIRIRHENDSILHGIDLPELNKNIDVVLSEQQRQTMMPA